MTIIVVMSETLPLASVKSRFSELVDRVQRQQDRVVVTRNGQPAAVLISADDLDSLEETLAVMTDHTLTQQIHASERAVAAAEPGTDLDVLRAGLQRRRAASR
jgi:prevent-host-death family protein